MIDKPKYDDYRHVLLYAKGHYATEKVIEDLRIIFAKRCGLEIDFMTDQAIWINMVNCLKRYAKPHELMNFIGELFKPEYDEDFPLMISHSDSCPFKRAIEKALRILRFTTVFDKEKKPLINIGKADADILPLKPFDNETNDAII